jgi:D-alanyl-D-alanine carboxypeptidase/D-alanyl-D-alanine-endopeptidase (penicillin-binding protein 4)
VTLVITPLPNTKLGNYIKSLVNEDEVSTGNWGIEAVNLNTGKTIIAHQADDFFLAASNVKLYTSAAALRRLGREYRYATPVLVNGTISGGKLAGDLLIIGMGDPTWSAHFYEGDGRQVFRQWADTLKAYGISTIQGGLAGVDGIFSDELYGAGWSWDEEQYYFAAPISGLIFNESSLDFKIIPEPFGGKPIVEPNPSTSFASIINNLVTLDTLSNSDSLTADWGFSRPRGSNQITLDGIFPPDTVETGAAVDSPILYALTVLKETLTSIAGDTLFVHRSPELGEIVRAMNKDSRNLIAETVLRTLGKGANTGGNARSGLGAARLEWAAMNLDTNAIYMVDGSGLSRYNRLTPATTVKLLETMFNDTTFFNSLPIAGIDGTLEHLMIGSPAAGRVHAKTGTLRHAVALSGYLRNKDDEWVAFSIMVNNHLTSTWRVNLRIQKICELLISAS